MSFMKSLTLTTLPKVQNDPARTRRERLVSRLQEQKEFVTNPSLVRTRNCRCWFLIGSLTIASAGRSATFTVWNAGGSLIGEADVLIVVAKVRSNHMKKLSSSQHGYLDYVTVVIFLAAPSLIGLSGLAGTISYALAGIHLAMTLVTDFPLGVVKLVPFTIHGWVERVVGPVLILLPFALGFEAQARSFYVFMGIIIIIVGLLTDYRRTQ